MTLSGSDAVPAGYNPLTNEWQSIDTMGQALGSLAATATKGQLHALGGYDANVTPLGADQRSLTPGTDARGSSATRPDRIAGADTARAE